MNLRILLLSTTALFLVSCGSAPSILDNSNTSALDAAVNSNSLGLEGSGTLLGDANVERQQLEDKLTQASNLIKEADSMDIATMQTEIRAKLDEARPLLEELSEIDDFFLRADELSQMITAIETKMQNYVVVDNLPEMANLAGRFPEIRIQSIARDGSDVYAIADTGVYGPLQNGADTATEVLFPEGMRGGRGSYALKFGEMFVSMTPSGLFTLNGSDLKAQTVNEGTWYPASSLIAYGRNIYMLDPVSNTFWKYERNNNGTFSKPTVAVDSASIKNTKIQSVAIDGNIYFLLTGGRLLKFTAGKEMEINVGANLASLSPEAQLFTELGSSYLYILDPSGKKVLRFIKKAGSLDLDKEYTLAGEYKTIFVAPGDKEALLSDGQKIFKLGL